MKKLLDIELLLQWAFKDELPKGGGTNGLLGASSAWGKILGLGQLGTLIQVDPNPSGTWLEQGEPHRDAMLIGEAVKDLRGCIISGWEEWQGFEDVPELAHALEDIPARMAARADAMPAHSRDVWPITLIITAATLGRGPDWAWAEAPLAEVVDIGGRPGWWVKEMRQRTGQKPIAVEVDGYDRKRRQPKPGAYRKFTVTPDPLGVALGRADWQMWVNGMNLVAEALTGALCDYEPVPSDRSLTPWLGTGAEAPQARILEAV